MEMLNPEVFLPSFMIAGTLKRIVREGDKASSNAASKILEGPESEYVKGYYSMESSPN